MAAWYREHEPKGEIVIIVAGKPAGRRKNGERDDGREEEAD